MRPSPSPACIDGTWIIVGTAELTVIIGSRVVYLWYRAKLPEIGWCWAAARSRWALGLDQKAKLMLLAA